VYLISNVLYADDDILCSLHRYRPKFLATSSGLPSYYDPYEFRHICLLQPQPSDDGITLSVDGYQNEAKKCLAIPFVASHHFQIQSVTEKLTKVIKEVCASLCFCSALVLQISIYRLVIHLCLPDQG